MILPLALGCRAMCCAAGKYPARASSRHNTKCFAVQLKRSRPKASARPRADGGTGAPPRPAHHGHSHRGSRTMPPREPAHRVLNAIDGIEIDAAANEPAATILHAGVVLCGIALMRIPDLHEREAQMGDIEPAVRNYIERCNERARARSSPYPRAATGHDVH